MKLLFLLDESPSSWIYRVHIQGIAALRNAFLEAGFDLTPEQWAIMARIRGHEGLSQSQLGEKTFKDRHNINRIINILEKRGYTERRPDEDDKRAYRLFLTEFGMDTLKKSTSIVLKHYKRRFSGISAGELDALRRILDHIVKNIKKLMNDKRANRGHSKK
ncbi:MAG: MarR family transcriptional regulator [Syntrophales bacterium]|jgi:DNA-binding MarR family transcriptional regulator